MSDINASVFFNTQSLPQSAWCPGKSWYFVTNYRWSHPASRISRPFQLPRSLWASWIRPLPPSGIPQYTCAASWVACCNRLWTDPTSTTCPFFLGRSSCLACISSCQLLAWCPFLSQFWFELHHRTDSGVLWAFPESDQVVHQIRWLCR